MEVLGRGVLVQASRPFLFLHMPKSYHWINTEHAWPEEGEDVRVRMTGGKETIARLMCSTGKYDTVQSEWVVDIEGKRYPIRMPYHKIKWWAKIEE